MDVLLTCGLGDLFAIESLLSKAETDAVTHIYYATRQEMKIRELLNACPHIFPNLKKETALYRDFTGPFTQRFCVMGKNDLKTLPLLEKDVNLDAITDWNVHDVGKAFMAGGRDYRGSGFLTGQILGATDMGMLVIPQDFVLIHPYSENAPAQYRDLSLPEWEATCRYLERTNQHGVVVNKGDYRMPVHPLVTDLTNLLSLPRAVALARKAAGFIGASSCFSVLSAKRLPANRLFVKGHADLRDNWWAAYYTPQPDNSFIATDLVAMLDAATV